MSDSYYLACVQCKEYVWVGQSQNSTPPYCFYSGDPKTMTALRKFLWDHMGHTLVHDESQTLVDTGRLKVDECGVP